MNKEEIHYENKKIKTTLKIKSKKGFRRYFFDKKGEDRIFFIELTDNKTGHKIDWYYDFNDQIELLRYVLANKILPQAFERYCKKIEDLLEELRELKKQNEEVS